jgi:uncharacterized protein (TIGR02246 family)
MKRVARCAVLVALVGCGSPGAARVPPGGRPAVDSAEAAAGIDTLEARFLAAYHRRDARALAGLYTEDVRFISDGAVQTGRAEMEDGWKTSLDDLSDLKLTTIERVMQGDVVTVTQRFTQRYKTIVDSGYAVEIVRREPDGQWRYRTVVLSRPPMEP